MFNYIYILRLFYVNIAWLGEYFFGDKRKLEATATSIQIFGNDHYILNTIVFAGKIGVHITHEANVIQGVHTWNLATGKNGTGILVETEIIRLLDCYLDYNDLVLNINPIKLVSIENTFFLGLFNANLRELLNMNINE